MHEKSCSGWQHDILRAARDTHDREQEREREWNGVNEKEREYKSGGGTFHFICVLSYFFILYNSLSISNIRETVEREKDTEGWCRNLGWASAQKIHKMLAPSMKISAGRRRNGNLVKRERNGDDEN
jgi:hypothetical protein